MEYFEKINQLLIPKLKEQGFTLTDLIKIGGVKKITVNLLNDEYDIYCSIIDSVCLIRKNDTLKFQEKYSENLIDQLNNYFNNEIKAANNS